MRAAGVRTTNAARRKTIRHHRANGGDRTMHADYIPPSSGRQIRHTCATGGKTRRTEARRQRHFVTASYKAQRNGENPAAFLPCADRSHWRRLPLARCPEAQSQTHLGDLAAKIGALLLADLRTAITKDLAKLVDVLTATSDVVEAVVGESGDNAADQQSKLFLSMSVLPSLQAARF
jgi:hypothetical protein